MSELLEMSKPEEWRAIDPENTLYLDFAAGRVVIALAPQFAPQHVANIKTLARAGYYDGLVFLRSQDNYVVQWGDPNEERPKSLGAAKPKVPAEMILPLAATKGFVKLLDGDVYAKESGVFDGWPVARDEKHAWLAHCYGMVGVGRGDDIDGASGAELYAVIGHSPRHLDRNITLVGRVVQGMELLSVLPRGTGPLGFYEKPEQHVRIEKVRVAADVPDRVKLQTLRTDSATYNKVLASRRTRSETWFKNPVGKLELCNAPLPVRKEK